jgi:hypothetical protein
MVKKSKNSILEMPEYFTQEELMQEYNKKKLENQTLRFEGTNSRTMADINLNPAFEIKDKHEDAFDNFNEDLAEEYTASGNGLL